jgi:hypothetical protein
VDIGGKGLGRTAIRLQGHSYRWTVAKRPLPADRSVSRIDCFQSRSHTLPIRITIASSDSETEAPIRAHPGGVDSQGVRRIIAC